MHRYALVCIGGWEKGNKWPCLFLRQVLFNALLSSGRLKGTPVTPTEKELRLRWRLRLGLAGRSS
jgi:hypothetical protein